MLRKWDSKDAAVQRKCIDEIITRIDEIGDATIGIVAAQEIIDIVTENLAPEIYNKGIADSKKMIAEKMADLEVDIGSLEQRIN